MSPYSTFFGNRDSFFLYNLPINGKRSNLNVGELSKFRQPCGAHHPQPYSIYKELFIFEMLWKLLSHLSNKKEFLKIKILFQFFLGKTKYYIFNKIRSMFLITHS